MPALLVVLHLAGPAARAAPGPVVAPPSAPGPVAAPPSAPLRVDALRPADATGPARIYVHQGDRRGVYVPDPSGDDLYLFWVETTLPPFRSGSLSPCADTARAVGLAVTVCTDPAPRGGRLGPLGHEVHVRTRHDGPAAELARLGRGTEQWVWAPIPARLAPSVPVPVDGLPGWSWNAAAWGVGVPLILPPLAGAPVPLVIGHRGSPGRLPDHTLEGYTLAVEQGADAIEPDLVITKDGVLVARHENELSQTTDVAARFPERRRTTVVDGDTVDGWFAEDFTLAELRTLRVVQPWPDRPHDHDGLYLIPTFDEVLDLAARLGAARGRPVAVVPETKHPSYFRALGLPLEPPLVEALRRHGVATANPSLPVIVQSFELANLQALAADVTVRRLLLVDAPTVTVPGDTRTYGDLLADLPALREKVECLGVSREMVWGADGPTDLLARAQAAGLQVFVWTFRAERPGPAGADVVAEIAAFLRLGVDGVFADQPDLAVQARDSLGR
jgi:glycerophosphoryl diester phosphodiesterase